MKASLDLETRACECCGRTHMLKTIKLEDEEIGEINLGVICAGKWFNLSLTGNIHQSINRIQRKINSMSETDLFYLIERIKLAGQGQ